MGRRVVKIMREQFCDIEVEAPDDWTDNQYWDLDALQLCQGLTCLEWETAVPYTVDLVSEATPARLEECSGKTAVKG